MYICVYGTSMREKCGGALALFIYLFFESIFLSSKSVNWAVCVLCAFFYLCVHVYPGSVCFSFHFTFSFFFDISWSFGLFSLFWKSLVVAFRLQYVMNNEIRKKIASFFSSSFLYSLSHVIDGAISMIYTHRIQSFWPLLFGCKIPFSLHSLEFYCIHSDFGFLVFDQTLILH